MRIERSSVDVEKVTGQIFCDSCGDAPEADQSGWVQFYTTGTPGHDNVKHCCKRCFYKIKVTLTYPRIYETLLMLGVEYNLEPWDICTHMEAAKVKNMNLEDYIKSLPHSYGEFVEHFRGTDFESLSLSFKQ